MSLKGTVMALVSSGIIAGTSTLLAVDSELFEETSKNELRYKGVLPKKVKTVAMLSTASYPGHPSQKQGMALIEKAGYKIKVGKHAFDLPRNGMSSSSWEGRLEDFYTAWNDPEVDMILCIRGGEGTFEMLEHLDWSRLKERPELIVMGYSDVTLLLCALQNKKMGHPVAGPMCGSMTGVTQASIDEMKKVFHFETVGPIRLTTLVPGNVKGLPLVGHLERLRRNWNTELRADVKDRVVFLECVNKKTEQIKEFMNELYDKGFFKEVAGVVFCHFTGIEPAKELHEFLDKFAKKIGKPAYKGFPFGHDAQCFTIDFARPVVIENGELKIP